MSVTNCPSCNTPAPPGAIFCDNCGFDLRSPGASAQQPVPPTFMVAEEGGGEVICPSCQNPNISGSVFCENCGTKLPTGQPPQQPQPPKAPAVEQPVLEEAPVIEQPAMVEPSVQPQPPTAVSIEGRFVVESSNASISIPQGKQTVVLGREDPVSGIFPEIDLDPHGAHEAGVGRRHAQLILQGGQTLIEDLDSVNGTVVNKQRLAPHQPQPIHDGDELILGKLALIYYSS